MRESTVQLNVHVPGEDPSVCGTVMALTLQRKAEKLLKPSGSVSVLNVT